MANTPSQLITTIDTTNNNVGVNNAVANGATNVVVLGNDQNVGIGTAAPVVGMHIVGDNTTHVIPAIYLTDSNGVTLPTVNANDGIFSVNQGVPTFNNANGALPILTSGNSATFLQTANNLSDLANATTAVANLNLASALTSASSPNTTISIDNSNAAYTFDLADVGTPNTYAYPTSLTTDAYGRVTSVTNGSAAGTVTEIDTDNVNITGGPITANGTITLNPVLTGITSINTVTFGSTGDIATTGTIAANNIPDNIVTSLQSNGGTITIDTAVNGTPTSPSIDVTTQYEAGTNITFTPNDGITTISASGGGSGGNVNASGSTTANGVVIFTDTSGDYDVVSSAVTIDPINGDIVTSGTISATNIPTGTIGNVTGPAVPVTVGNLASFADSTGLVLKDSGTTIYDDSTGTLNLFIGSNAGNINVIGGENIAIGYETLTNTTMGIQNIAIGTAGLFSNIEGNSNIAVGSGALYYNTEGNSNVGIGWNTLLNSVTGNNNTAIGYKSGTSDDFSNCTAIGANALVSIDNSIVLGNGTCNVGIGESSPTYGLHLGAASGSFVPQVYMTSSDAPTATVLADNGIYSVTTGVPTFTSGTSQHTGTIVTAQTGGTAATVGTGELIAGSATVTTRSVTASSIIVATPINKSGISILTTGTLYIDSITDNVSFTVASTNTGDVNTFNWIIINP